MLHRLYFFWRYFRNQTPWDTNTTPPEIVQFVEIEKFPPGRALELGCGTGTNAIYLAQHGFETIAIDFVPRAIETARAKALAANVNIDFRRADVLEAGPFAQPFDFILDIGCLHGLDENARARYAQNIRAWTHDGSVFMLYAFFAFKDGRRPRGIARAELEKLFAASFTLTHYEGDAKSAWYRWERK